ncbi:hypothetical protein EG359_01105 [Chryseobacterium joostei]|uniref:VCBS repeat-containing protein n=1 Tax=Chryseobacterium joostei TaxID=112234 RepID=A0A1N7IRM2_9FLAO|nr:hypothetical protein [Chryseobacterium joostei]AZA98284.1 hypothetical protein EG359_01105 [Chryseobacterium joostei]SIS39749.1 hypothetical protein SAMN05421768_106305 [Chryseobacterium joostei]
MTKLLFFLLLIVNICHAQKTEHFTDAKTVIKSGKYKINITQTNQKPEAVVRFQLFRKSGKNWQEIQNGSFKKQTDFGLYVTTDEDLNNDGYNDIKISYEQAGRGSNEITKLFIFNPKTQKLEDIVNSQEYPNLHYNAKRNCVNGYAFHGGNTTYFLKINGNKLQNFARVEYYIDTVYSYKIKNGKEILLKKQAYNSDSGATFFSNFDPVEE